MVDIDFDSVEEYVVRGEEFKSWNNDRNFMFNCIYFKFTKPSKVEVEFWADPGPVFGVVDILLWPTSYYEVKPTQIIPNRDEPQKPASFQFYANPFFRGKKEGSFEPRVYNTGNVSKVVIKKLLELKKNDWCKYALFLIHRAKDMIELAREKAKGQDFGLCLHFSRFCIEFSLKSIFPMFERNIPWKHDVSEYFSEDLRRGILKQSPKFAEVLPRLLWISQLNSPRTRPRLDFYGDSLSRAPPDLFITPDEAKVALTNAELSYRKCCELFDKVMRKT